MDLGLEALPLNGFGRAFHLWLSCLLPRPHFRHPVLEMAFPIKHVSVCEHKHGEETKHSFSL